METGIAIALVLLSLLEIGRLVAALARPEPPYRVLSEPAPESGEPGYRAHLGAVLDCAPERLALVDPMFSGRAFYDAQVEAISRAERSVHVTYYIFRPGRTAERFVEALAERARAGVEVRVLLDWFGSLRTRKSYLAAIEEAGGKVEWYHPLRWDLWPRLNHRSHQNILVIDGSLAYVGGAGVADIWWDGRRTRRHRPWRDSCFRIEGEAVAGLQAAFAQNWAAAVGEVLNRSTDFPIPPADTSGAHTLVINGTPTRGGLVRSRVLFQLLINGARKRIRIETPYFLPDASARREMREAISRGVEIEIVVPGRHAVPFFTRRCSRRHYGDLLKAGAKIYEYKRAMMHAKTLVVDDRWSVFGSTNFDPRSFGINDEINVAVQDAELARSLEEQFAVDKEKSEEISYKQWRRRPPWERVTELLSAVFERQQ